MDGFETHGEDEADTTFELVPWGTKQMSPPASAHLQIQQATC